MLNVTEEEFLKRNSEVRLFRSDKEAHNFYNLLASENTRPAMLMLIAEIEKFGWWNINNRLNTARNFPHDDTLFIEKVLGYRIDDFIVIFDIVGGCVELYGNYLLTDLIQLDGDELVYRVESSFITRMAYNALRVKQEFLDKLSSDVTTNLGNYNIHFMCRVLLYKRFLDTTNSSSVSAYKALVDSVYAKVETRLKSLLWYLQSSLDQELVILSRFRLLSIGSNADYQSFFESIRDNPGLEHMISLLDIVRYD